MLRVFLMILVVLGGYGCATTGTSAVGAIAPATTGYSPSTSHFWCGDHCAVMAGCEEGLICDCVEYYSGVGGSITTQIAAETQLWDHAVLLLRVVDFPAMTVEELRRQPHEIREVYGALNNTKFVCGTFPRHNQFGSAPKADEKQ